MEKIIKLLSSQAKHGCYQMLPPSLLSVMPELEKYNFSRRLDSKRYEWFAERLDFTGKKVLDIGANIGYFSFRLALGESAIITVYEPYKIHAEAIQEIQKIVKVKNDEFTCVNKGVGLNDIEYLPEQDIILFFNVLQHAGEDFDKDLIEKIDQWKDYAIQYLNKLTFKARYLIFQLGYTWLGDSGYLCKDEEIIDFTVSILNKTGWTIRNCGVISNVINPVYKDLIINNKHNKHPIINRKDMLVSKSLNKIKLLKLDYRFMQRPLFICENLGPV
jgi:hypothetical protein